MTRANMHRSAAKLIKEQGKFLLLFDIVGSKAWGKAHGYQEMYDLLHRFIRRVNRQFSHLFLSEPLGFRGDKRKFKCLVGDGGGGFAASAVAIDEIPALAKKLLPFKLRWAVARDDWDERCKRILH